MGIKLTFDIYIKNIHIILSMALTIYVLLLLHHTFAILAIAHLVHYRINLRDFIILILLEYVLVFFSKLNLLIQELRVFFFIVHDTFIFVDACKS